MAIDFPNSPVAGTVFGAWRFDGTKWGAVSGVSGGGSAGDITAVLAGAGLSGGGTEGDVSIALAVPVTVARGGTGATDAATALTNLGGAPLASPTFTGDPKAPTPAAGDNDTSVATTAYVKAQGYLTAPVGLTTQVTGVLPIANGGSGSSTAAAAPWVEVGGDTMTGDLNISKSSGDAQLTISKPTSGTSCYLFAKTGTSVRWVINFSNNEAEAGGNGGSNFQIFRYNDGGGYIDAPLTINRSSGITTLTSANVYAAASFPVASNALLKVGVVGGYYGIGLRTNTGGSGGMIIFENVGATGIGSITNNDTNVAFNTSSDARLKEDPRDFDAGPIIDNTNVYDFAWKLNGKRAYGVFAQEAAEVYPQAITHDEIGDTWGADYSMYVPILLQELKALRARVRALEK